MRRWLIALALAFWLAGCGRTPIQQQEAYVFGTRVEVLVADAEPAKARTAIATVLREFDRLHRAYHAWQPSELTALNEAIGAGRPHTVTPEFAAFIGEAQALAARGDHLFDPGIGRLIELWGFHADEFKGSVPALPAIEAWRRSHPSIADLVLEGTTVKSRNRDVALDFGGYLKGAALDRAAALLRSQGIANALINIGGNVMALGSKEGRKWRVGIQHPRQPGPLATLELEDGEAIGTSGDYQRFFEVDGRRYPHLLDPRSGYPAGHTQAVTIVIPPGERAGTLSDALSKPIFIAGPKGWHEAARRLAVGQVLRVDAGGEIFLTQALKDRLQFVGTPPPLTVLP